MITVTQKEKKHPGKIMKAGGFKSAYHSMPHSELSKVREDICEKCYWSYAKFRSKINGKRYFTVFEVMIIADYFAENGIDAWSGKSIN